MPDVFLSYSREDQPRARLFAEALEQEGFSVWWDQALDPGETYDEVTSNALDSALAAVVLWSTKSVTSRWVRAEATLADRQGKLFPAQIEACRLPIQFELTQTADLAGWSGDRGEPRWQSFIASLRRACAKQRPLQAEGTAAPSNAALPQPRQLPETVRRHRLLYWGVAAAAVLGLAIAAWQFLPARKAAPESAAEIPGEARPEAASAATEAQPSIAVLPFRNLSSDPEQEYFSDGLSEELLNQLTKVPKLRVIGRASSFAFKGQDQDLRRIAESLGVNHILDGSVRKAGDRLRISAQLINPADGSQLWSEVYERKLEDVFAIQEEIARTVAQSLQLTLATGTSGGTTNFEAFDEFLAGRAPLARNNQFLDSAAVAHLERAVALDPGYLTAWVWLIDAYTRQLFVLEQRQEARKRQIAAIEQVVSLAPGSAFAQVAQSYDAMVKRDLLAADQLLSESMDAPSDLGLRTQLRYGQFLGSVGRRADALPVIERVVAADPLDSFARLQLVSAHAGMGNFGQAGAELERVLALPGGDVPIARGQKLVLAMGRGDREAVLGELENFRAFNEPVGRILVAHKDNLEAAMPDLAELLQDERHNKDPYVLTATAAWAGYLGSPDVANSALRRLPGLGLSFETWAGFLWGPTLGETRGTPGFKAFARDLGLVDYWRATGNWGDFCKPVGTGDFECR